LKRKPRIISAFQSLFNRRVFILLLILLQIGLTVMLLMRWSQLKWLADGFKLFSLITALHLLLRNDKAAFKLSLIFLILLFPLVGGVFYWIFHSQTNSGGLRKRLSNVEKKTNVFFEYPETAYREAVEAISSAQKMLHYMKNNTPFPIYQNTETEYFRNGQSMLSRLLEDLQAAKHYIFMEYFIIADGVMWESILAVLQERVRTGVDVRIIYDDIGSMPTLPPAYAKKLRAMGIRCEKFNPFHPFLTSTQNNRDHRKITVIDGQIAYTGGINLADEYIDKKIRFGTWKDSAIRLKGDAAWGFAVMFLQIWSLLVRREEDFEVYKPRLPHNVSTKSGWIQPYSDSPMDNESVGEQLYLRIIERAHSYLYITTPYLMVDDHMIAALKSAAKCGVDVRIITPEIPDKKSVHFTSRSYYGTLVDAGVKVYEYTGGFMHAKNVVSDDTVATVGTTNFDFRSLYLHFECGVCLYQTDSIAEIKRDYLETLTQCKEIKKEDCRGNLFVWFLRSIFRILAPLM